jgi:methylenetetrahydrofolate dehydrogenase (NADP+)/methenyltetrahydrofolate cyclohydrolase
LAIREEIGADTARLLQKTGIVPGLAAVLVGENPASQVYVRNKRQACDKAGMTSWLHQMPADISQLDLVKLINQLNADVAVHGILVQLPLPSHLDTAAVLDAIDPAKSPEALNVPGFDFHGLQGKPKRYSVHVNGPWCITFEWQGENAVKLDFENYH